MKGFREKLAERQEKVNSLVCVGLDPLVSLIPFCVTKSYIDTEVSVSIISWMKKIIDATAPYACMFKPNSAHWEAIPDNAGKQALSSAVNYIHKNHPDIPVFLDCKRGDIGRTQERYGKAHLILDGVDGMNYNPYMGKDCVEYLTLLAGKEKALVGVCYTSNKSAREIQDILTVGSFRMTFPLWEVIAAKVLRWSTDLGVLENAGLVMAAAYKDEEKIIHSHHLERARIIVRDKLWFLIPGIDTQGGLIEETVKHSYVGPGSIAINSSSGIIFASQGDDFAEAAANKAKELRDEINSVKGYFATIPGQGEKQCPKT